MIQSLIMRGLTDNPTLLILNNCFEIVFLVAKNALLMLYTLTSQLETLHYALA